MNNIVRVLAFLAMFVSLLVACAKQPAQEMETAKASLEAITKAGAKVYAKVELKRLTDDLTSAQNEVYGQSKRLFKKYGRAKEMLARIQADADALLPAIEVRKEITHKYPLSTSFYLGKDSKLVTSISESWATSFSSFSYGNGPAPDLPVQVFSHKLQNERLSSVVSYFLMLASAGEAQVELDFLIKRGREAIVLASDKFKVVSDQYTSYYSFLTPKDTEIVDGDIFALRIRAKGNSFGIQCGPNASMVTFLSPRAEVAEETLNGRAEVIDWIIKNNKFGGATPLVYNVYRNIDDLILNKKDGSWNIGKGLTKSGNYYTLGWMGNKLKVDILSEAQAKEKKVGEDSMTFTRRD